MLKFNKQLQNQFNKMSKTGKLFRSSLTGQEIWDLYLNSFEQDPIFRDPESSEHNCNLCKNFIRRYGNIVAAEESFDIINLFDFEAEGEFNIVVKTLSKALTASKIKEVFFETYQELNSLNYEKTTKSASKFRLGIDKNIKRYTKEEAEKFGVVKANQIVTFNHMHIDIPSMFVDQSGKSVESIMGEFRSSKEVFERAMKEIPLDVLNLVKDLINQGSLLDGTTHLYKIEQIIPLKKEYDEFIFPFKQENFCWTAAYKLPFAKFRNELIGTLCSDIASGMDLNVACQTWNKRVDPANYMKASAPITKKQIEDARKFVEENGYSESFDRRFATIDDIKASEILHINSGDGKLKSVSIFDSVKSSSPTSKKKNEFTGVEEVAIDKFMKDILPGCTSVEAFLANSHSGNMVSLTTSNVKESKPIFKWDNNYSWTFNGNLAGKSMIKEAIKSRGGNTEGILNIRLAFPETTDDYDLHVHEPNGGHIYYSNVREKQRSSGILDLDANGVDGRQVPEKRVENIIYTDLSKMPEGEYLISVKNYSNRGFSVNFTLEIEVDGQTTVLELDGKSSDNTVNVAKINLVKGNFEVTPLSKINVISSNTISKEIYGLSSNEFHKVNLACLSPNHWDENNVGNKFYFFMLENCKSPTSIRSFHVENLIPSLAEHRKVLEVLGGTTMIEPSDNQLSGLGFNSTIKDELIVRLEGSHKRMLKIKF